ncbi:glycosyltransferase family 39 protein [Pontibacter silvestris]|uniref:Glycosyltransferase family 39 protein n=1 Tax=Pontibacter silvestris TaxID=2305183 RepID=A0ABW4WYC2_9BACT|nr:glycosyltransferase family 39 protein [Pontibacter silvestris]MCC9136831.1 glycosyltransferase family 39 protein [Pontibacter silvestris]
MQITSDLSSEKAATPTPTKERYLISLPVILFIALIIRLLAAFFSKGFAFHDDHFDVITIAQGWLDGFPFWLYEDMPPRHSMFYVGIHYVLFNIMNSIGLPSPETKMTVARLLHGLYSLLIVYFGYKITDKLSTKANARLVGMMLALLWFMPFMSVRNLVEMVCIPPYMAGFYLMIKQENSKVAKRFFWAGALFAIAFVLRYHTVLLAGGAGLVLLYRKQWREILWFGLGFAVIATIIQGTIDIIFFDYPFHSVITYFLYNSENAYNYSTGPIYRFALTILGFLVPPVSLFLVFGYARTSKLSPLLFWAGLVFFIAHSLFPNKQERFILPLFPLIMILGVIGWQSFVKQSTFWQKRQKLLAGCWILFWSLNIIAALGMALTYTKKSRVAPLVYLSQKANMDALLLEFGNHSPKKPPLFYLGRSSAEYRDYKYDPDKKRVWDKYRAGTPLPEDFIMVYSLNGEKPVQELAREINDTKYKPDYLVMVGSDDMAERMERIHSVYPKLKLDHTITPSLYDQLLHFLNPRVHKDEQVSIYEILPTK